VEVPQCDDCGGWLKSATISFGQPMPAAAMAEASAAAQRSDLFVVVGSSLVVHPAADLPVQAVRSGARLAIVNASETALDPYADLIIQGQAGTIMPEVVARVGSPSIVERMMRHGLVAESAGTLRAAANVFRHIRQQDMLSALEHYVLPALTAGVDGEGQATLHTLYLTLDTAAARGLRSLRVQTMFNRLIAISDEPADGELARLTTMVIGTSRVLADELDVGEQALRHLQQASIQRATPSESDLAVVSEYVMLADPNRHEEAQKAIDDFVSGFGAEHARSTREATYHLTVASHWRRSAKAGERADG